MVGADKSRDTGWPAVTSSSDTRELAFIGGAVAIGGAIVAGSAAVAVAGYAVTSWLTRRREKQAAAAAAFRRPPDRSQRIPWHDHDAWAAQSDLEPELIAVLREAYESGWPKEEPAPAEQHGAQVEADQPEEIRAEESPAAEPEPPRAEPTEPQQVEPAETQAQDHRPAAPRKRPRSRSPRTRYQPPKRPAVVSAPPVDQVDPDGPTPRAAGPPRSR